MAVLVVQMGHVGRTSGATGAPGEQVLTGRIGNACARLLNRDGWQVRLVGADPPRSAYAGDAFCAFHADGNNNPNVSGASVGYQGGAQGPGGRLADEWAHWWLRLGFEGSWHSDNYTTNLANYYGVTEARRQGNVRAFIAEVGTITNPDDRAYITSQDGVDRAAIALGSALGMRFEEQDMTPEQDRRLGNVHAQLVGEDSGDGVTPPDIYPGWPMPNGQRLTLVGGVQATMGMVLDLREDVDALLNRPPAGPSAAEVAAEIIRQLGGTPR